MQACSDRISVDPIVGLVVRAVKPGKATLPRDPDKAKRERELVAKRLAGVVPKGAGKAPARVLADALGIGERDARYYLDAKRAPSLGVLAQIERVYGLTPAQLLEPGDVDATPGGRILPQLEAPLGLYVDALVGAVNDVLAHDHELELTRKGREFLATVFDDLGKQLQVHGSVDATSLFRATEALKRSTRKKRDA